MSSITDKERSLLLLQQLVPGSGYSNIPFALQVASRVQWWPLQEAVHHLLRRHRALRTVLPRTATRLVSGRCRWMRREWTSRCSPRLRRSCPSCSRDSARHRSCCVATRCSGSGCSSAPPAMWSPLCCTISCSTPRPCDPCRPSWSRSTTSSPRMARFRSRSPGRLIRSRSARPARRASATGESSYSVPARP